jgi:hypothetical protein
VIASSPTSCAADLVLEGKTGITFSTGDTDKCYRFLKSLCEDRGRLTDMGRNSAALIQFFSFSHIVDSVASIMKQPLMNQRRFLLSAAL